MHRSTNFEIIEQLMKQVAVRTKDIPALCDILGLRYDYVAKEMISYLENEVD